jgi:hypothetical protein
VDDAFAEGLADALGDAALELALQQQRVQDTAEVVRRMV